MAARILIGIFLFLGGWTIMPAQSVQALDSHIKMGLTAKMDGRGNWSRGLEFKTIQIFDCKDSHVQIVPKFSGTKITLTIKGVLEPHPCTESLGPARGFADLTNLADGQYDLKIWLNRQLYKGKLSIGGETMRLETIENPDLVKVANHALQFIPRGVIHGEFRFAHEAMRTEVAHILADFRAEGGGTPDLPAGNYGQFYLHEDGSILEQKEKGVFVQAFLLTWSGDAARLQLILDMYSKKFGQEIQGYFRDDSGKFYRLGN